MNKRQKKKRDKRRIEMMNEGFGNIRMAITTVTSSLEELLVMSRESIMTLATLRADKKGTVLSEEINEICKEIQEGKINYEDLVGEDQKIPTYENLE